ncbi:alpha/beta hydrolase [Nocardioides sp. QY071]|uniref:alpha/beta fold hydrolase n=1 Tax=Nocardioides sp. QY071 TaxID=3044187 RepID=UPI00249AE1D5|nr:alpha/beta hydrolase [Nocardioides sp. QY071]WGY01671.1 alpha/beta hydrolase [Nocardioides sp. QY071]
MSCSLPGADPPPSWFVAALQDGGQDHAVEVHGARVAYRAWGPRGAPVVVLVHGGAAHAGWWDHVAPALTPRHRVVALDLTGHGSSDARSRYDLLSWADEIEAVGTAEAEGDVFSVAGHSLGSVAALVTAYRHGDRVAGTIAVDPPDWLVAEGGLEARRTVLNPRRFHPSRELAAARFQARPTDPARVPYVERHVAEGSVHLTPDGWTWRFDPAVTGHDTFPDELWGNDIGPVVLVRAERGLLSADQAAELCDRLGGAEDLIIEDSGHHVMLDQPIALTGCLQDVLARWTLTRRHGRQGPRSCHRGG